MAKHKEVKELESTGATGTHEENHELELDAQAVQAVHDLQNKNAALQSAFSEVQRQKTALVYQRVGRKQIISMVSKLLTVTDLLDLKTIKESKEYKGLLHTSPDGKTEPVTTWSDYCRLIEGRSAESIDNDLLNLKTFGEEMFDSMRQVGIGPGTMRALRKLPEEDIIQIDEVVKSKDEEKIKATIQDLQEKYAREKQQLAKEKEQLTKERDDAREDKQALEEVVSDKTSKILELEKQISRKRLERLPPDEESAQLRKEANDLLYEVEVAIRQLVKPLEAVMAHADEHQLDVGHWLRGQLDQLSEATEYLREQLGMVPWQQPVDPDLDGEQWDGQVIDAERTVQ